MHKTVLILLFLMLGCINTAWAEEVYMEPERFVESHAALTNKSKSLWITGALRKQAEAVLEHRPHALRQRYWQNGQRTIWIMDEIGKEEPITIGFAVEKGKIIDAKVLIFRESRGWEIRYPSFTQQFADARLQDDSKLDRRIDGISGATLSVNAMRKLARLALTYHAHIMTSAKAEASVQP